MDTISILTPFKNAQKYIVHTAESILKQSHQNWQWILVNDHSNQNEVTLLHDILKDKRVQLIDNKGVGIVSALATGFELATGAYTTRMDADDLMPTDKLEQMLCFLKTHHADVATGKVQYFTKEAAISDGYKKYESWLNERVEKQDFYQEIYRECTIASGNWLIATNTLQKIGGFDGLHYPEDYDLLFRFYQNKLSIAGIDYISHCWRDHSERTSKNSQNYGQKQFFDLKINRLVELENLNLPLVLNGTGHKGRLVAAILLARNILFDWVSHQPEKYPIGILGQKILSIQDIAYLQNILILNTTLIDTNAIAQAYELKNKIARIITL